MGAGHVVCKIPNVRNGVLVWNYCIVESSKISTGVPRTVRFRHHVKGRSPRRIALPDNASLLHPLKLGLSSSVLLGVQTARRGRDGWSPCHHMMADIMLSWPGSETKTNDLGNSAKTSWYSTDTLESSVEGEEEGSSGSCTSPSTEMSRWRAMLTSNWWCRKKSAPRMGQSTVAKVKFQSNWWVPLEDQEKERGRVLFPQLGIG